MRSAIAFGMGAMLLGMMQPTGRPSIKMGLWEMSSTSTFSGENLPTVMAGLNGRPTTIRYCIDEASYKNSVGGQNKGCTKSNEVWGPQSFSFDLTCSSGMKSHVEATMLSMESYRVVTHGTMVMQGKSMKMDNEGTSHFISADCGGLKPGAAQIGK